ncbi:MAG TPA: NmrA/HSCARG family protein [Longimicrobiales bacterium]
MAAMESQRRVVLVIGATGRQGGAVARHLLRRGGFHVRALTRDPGKPAARELADAGAEIVRGDLDQPETLLLALEGVSGVFSVQNFWEAGYDREIRQGVAIAEAARDAGVEHFVYSSVGSAHRGTGLPHFESKWRIEQRIRELGLPYTILRPVFFMENWARMRDGIRGGTLSTPLSPGRRLQQIAVDDIGAFAALAFADPDRWLGRELDIAGDEPTMEQTAEAFSRVLGREVRYVQVPWDEFARRAGEEAAKMWRWFEDSGYEADIAALRELHPGLRTLEQHLREDPVWSQANGQ